LRVFPELAGCAMPGAFPERRLHKIALTNSVWGGIHPAAGFSPPLDFGHSWFSSASWPSVIGQRSPKNAGSYRDLRLCQ
jgi:hypothetical protein